MVVKFENVPLNMDLANFDVGHVVIVGSVLKRRNSPCRKYVPCSIRISAENGTAPRNKMFASQRRSFSFLLF